MMSVRKAALYGLTDDADFIYDTEVEVSGNSGCFFIDDALVEQISYEKIYTIELEGGIELVVNFSHIARASDTDPFVAHFEII